MKTILYFLVIVLTSFIVCDSEASSTKTNTIMLLDDQKAIGYTDSAIELVNRYAGEVYHVFRSEALMSYVSPDNVAHLNFSKWRKR